MTKTETHYNQMFKDTKKGETHSYDLQFCAHCSQMTNHLGGICQRCDECLKCRCKRSDHPRHSCDEFVSGEREEDDEKVIDKLTNNFILEDIKKEAIMDEATASAELASRPKILKTNLCGCDNNQLKCKKFGNERRKFYQQGYDEGYKAGQESMAQLIFESTSKLQ